MNNKNQLTRKQNQKRLALLRQMRQDMEVIKDEIEKAKKVNYKMGFLQAIRIFLRFNQMIAPYIVTAGITFSIFTAWGETPFVENDVKKKLETKKEIDSKGNIQYEKSYDHFENDVSVISYFGVWEGDQNGFYQREVKTYSIQKLDQDIVEQIINEDASYSLDEILGSPIASKIEIKNNLSREEIEGKPYLQAVIYSYDDDDFIVMKEGYERNSTMTVLWLLFLGVLSYLPHAYRRDMRSFVFSKCVREIKDKYPKINTKELTKKLAIRMDNYDRLTR